MRTTGTILILMSTLLCFVGLSTVVATPMAIITAEGMHKQFNYAPYIAFYDPQDGTAIKAIDLFREYLSNTDINVKYVAISSAQRLISQLEKSNAEIHMYLFHGDEYGMAMGKQVISWTHLQALIEEAKPTYHLFASCYSKKVEEAGNGKVITGASGNVDFVVSTTAVAINLERILERKLSPKAEMLYKNIIETVKAYDQEFVYRMIDPIEPFQVLHYENDLHRDATDVLDKLDNIFSDSPLEPAWEFIIQLLRTLVDEQITKPVWTDYEENGHEIYIDGLIPGLNLALGAWAGIVEHAYFDENLPFEIYAKTVQVELWLMAEAKIQVYPFGIPIELEFEYQMNLFFEFLLDYWASDASDPAAVIDSSYNNSLFVASDPNLAPESFTQLLGYAEVQGPYGDRIIEAWFGCPALWIPLPIRIYGDVCVGVKGTPGISLSEVWSNLPDLQIPIGVGVDLWGVFTLCNTGIRVTFDLIPYIELEHTWPPENDDDDDDDDELEIGLELVFWLRFSVPIEAVIRWDEFGIWIEHVILFYGVFEADLRVEVTIGPLELKVNLLDAMGIDNAFYLNHDDWSGINKNRPLIANPAWQFNGTSDTAFGPGIDEIFSGDAFAACMTNAFFSGTISIENGSVRDRTAPLVEFLTPNSADDNVTWGDPNPDYEEAGTGTPPPFTISVIDMFDEPIGNFIDKEVLNTDNMASLRAVKNHTYTLSGDDATLDFYTFDLHDHINRDSEVTYLGLAVDWDPRRGHEKQEKNDVLCDDPPSFFIRKRTYSAEQDGTYMIRAYIEATIPVGMSVRIFDENDTEVQVLDHTPLNLDTTRTFITPWVKGDTLTIDIFYWQVDPDFPSPYLKVNMIESYFDPSEELVWDSNHDASSLHGFIEKVSEISNGNGLGPATGSEGHIARWTAHLNLMARMVNQDLPAGWHEFFVIAKDTSGLIGTNSKMYFLSRPNDTDAPELTMVPTFGIDGNGAGISLQSAKNAKDYRTGMTSSDNTTLVWKYNEPSSFVSYTFNYGDNQSTYDLTSGFNTIFGTRVCIYDVSDRIISTHGSGSANGYRYWFAEDHSFETGTGYEPVNSDLLTLKFDFKASSPYWAIVIRMDTINANYSNYKLIYNASSPLEGLLNNNIYVGYEIDPFSDGVWHKVTLSLGKHFKNALIDDFPDAQITTVDAFEIYGDVCLDNLILDESSFEDCQDGDLTDWEVLDIGPSGAYLVNEIDEDKRYLLHEENITHTSSSSQEYTFEYFVDVESFLGSDLARDLQFEITAYDNEGNPSTQTFWLLIYAPQEATITLDEPAVNATISGETMIRTLASDANGLEDVQYSIYHGYCIESGSMIFDTITGFYETSWNTTGYEDGTYDITIRTIDKYGDITSLTREVTVYNSVDAELTFTEPTPNAGPDPADPTLILLDGVVYIEVAAFDGNGLVKIEIKFNNGNYEEIMYLTPSGPSPDPDDPYCGWCGYYYWDTTTVTDGDYTITIRTTDLYGNQNLFTLDVIVYNPVDAVITFISPTPSEGSTVAGTITIRVEAADLNGLLNVQYSIGGGFFDMINMTTYYEITLDTNAFSDGILTITIRTTDEFYGLRSDGVGQATVTLTVTVYNPDPATVTFNNPSQGSTVSGDVTIEIDASDPDGLWKVEYKIDDGTYEEIFGQGTYSVLWETKYDEAQSGSHTIYIRTTDPYGGVQIFTCTVTVDNRAKLTWSSPSSDENVHHSIWIRVRVTEPNGISSVRFKIDSGSYTSMTYEGNGYYKVLWDTTGHSDGSHNITIKVTDSTGAQRWFLRSVNIVNGEHVGTVTILSPSDGSTVSGAGVTITASVSDPDGIVSVEWRVDGTDWQSMSGSGSTRTAYWSLTGVDTGWYIIRVRITDTYGDIVETSIIVYREFGIN